MQSFDKMGIFRAFIRALFGSRPRRDDLYRPEVRPTRDDVYRPVVRPLQKPPVNHSVTPVSAGPNRVVHGIALVETIRGRCYVVDGDTITIGKTNIRLSGIDAPEMDQPYGKVAKSALINLCNGHEISAEFADHYSYERHVATCLLPDGRDLSAEMVKLGLALDWRKFSGGKYRHLEPEGVRRKL